MRHCSWLLLAAALVLPGCAKTSETTTPSATSDTPVEPAPASDTSLPADAPATELAAADTEPAANSDSDSDWIVLFDGTSLDGWEANENPDTWKLEDGKLIAHGPRSHLFYVGPVHGGKFKNFELKVEVMTEPNANSGIYFHTEVEPTGWPSKGYEVQVNNTHKDPKKTGGLYAVQDNFEAPVADGEWFTQHIVVQGKHVTVHVNGKPIVDYTEEENPERPAAMAGRLLGEGTFALQGHDPGSVVYYRKIMVKPLPDSE